MRTEKHTSQYLYVSISGFRATLSSNEDLETTHGFTNGELARRVKVQACDKMLHSYQKDKGRQTVKWKKKNKNGGTR